MVRIEGLRSRVVGDLTPHQITRPRKTDPRIEFGAIIWGKENISNSNATANVEYLLLVESGWGVGSSDPKACSWYCSLIGATPRCRQDTWGGSAKAPLYLTCNRGTREARGHRFTCWGAKNTPFWGASGCSKRSFNRKLGCKATPEGGH